jgi:hypothetical protein
MLYEETARRNPDIHFKSMVVAMSDFANKHTELDQLHLQGEF